MATSGRLWDFQFQMNPYPGRANIRAVVSFKHGPFVFHGVRVIKNDDRGGRWLLAFPDKPKVRGCHACGTAVPVVHTYCFSCGERLGPAAVAPDANGRVNTYVEMFHPYDTPGRLLVESEVFGAYLREPGADAGGVNAAAG